MNLVARRGAAMLLGLPAEPALAHGEEVILRPITLSVLAIGVAFGAWAAMRRNRFWAILGKAVALHIVGLVAYFTLTQGRSLEALALFAVIVPLLGLLPLAAVFLVTCATLRFLRRCLGKGPRKPAVPNDEPRTVGTSHPRPGRRPR
jgi:hypothetical protein